MSDLETPEEFAEEFLLSVMRGKITDNRASLILRLRRWQEAVRAEVLEVAYSNHRLFAELLVCLATGRNAGDAHSLGCTLAHRGDPPERCGCVVERVAIAIEGAQLAAEKRGRADERARMSRHPALVCCHEAARSPEPEQLGLCSLCRDVLQNIARAERRRIAEAIRTKAPLMNLRQLAEWIESGRASEEAKC